MIRRPPRSTLSSSSAASDVYKRQIQMDLKWISVGMSISSNIYRLDSVFFIRHSVFSKYLKFRVNSEKTVNSIFGSKTGPSIDEFRWISSGYQWACLFPLIFIDWTQCFSFDTLFSEIFEISRKFRKNRQFDI